MLKYACAILFLALCAEARPSALDDVTVPELDLAKYLGRWYTTFSNRLGWLTHGDDAKCMTATYGVYNATTITVYNHNLDANNEVNDIGGFGYATDEPGKFGVFLTGTPFVASYWVLALGPVIDGMYDYAVVSNEGNWSLYVLTRNVERFRTEYEDDVLEFLRVRDFTDVTTRPIPIEHPADCVYPPMNA